MLPVLLDLLFPADCAGCGRPGESLCPACRAAVARPRAHRPEPCPAGLPPLAVSGEYAGAARSALLAYKERGRRDLTDPLAAALAAAVCWVLSAGAGRSPPDRSGQRAAPVLLVPIPSRPSAARARGGDHVLRLARACALMLPRRGLRAGVIAALRVGRPIRDSAGLSAAQRAANLAGAFSLTPAGRRLSGAGRSGRGLTLRGHAGRGQVGHGDAGGGQLGHDPGGRGGADRVCVTRAWGGRAARPRVIVVDDLVTTGATLAEACRTLARAGLSVVAAAAIAGTARDENSLPR